MPYFLHTDLYSHKYILNKFKKEKLFKIYISEAQTL